MQSTVLNITLVICLVAGFSSVFYSGVQYTLLLRDVRRKLPSAKPASEFDIFFKLRMADEYARLYPNGRRFKSSVRAGLIGGALMALVMIIQFVRGMWVLINR
jgi:hypothetical protein